jgi:hypothetical protein
MKINLLRTVACGLGLSISGWAYADYGYPGSGQYVSPSQWSNFNAPAAQRSAASESQSSVQKSSDLPQLPALRSKSLV